MAESILKVDDLHVTFPTEGGDVRAVRGINFDLAPQEILGIVGESGAGKSMTGAAVLGLIDQPGRIATCGATLISPTAVMSAENLVR